MLVLFFILCITIFCMTIVYFCFFLFVFFVFFFFFFFMFFFLFFFFFFSSRRRHTRSLCDWSSDVCSSDLSSAPLAYNWIVDLTPPTVQITAAPAPLTNSTQANFQWTAADALSGQIGRASCRGKSVGLGGGGNIKKKRERNKWRDDGAEVKI